MGCRENIDYVNVAGSSSHITNIYAWQWSLSSWKINSKLAREKHQERERLIKQEEPPIKWFELPKTAFWHSFNWKLEAKKIFEIYPRIGYS